MATGRYLTSAWRTLSSAFTFDPTGEKFAFARFRGGGGGGGADEDETVAAAAGGGSGSGRRSAALDLGATELAEIQSNGETAAAARRKTNDSDSALKDAGGDFRPTDDDDKYASGSELKTDRNQISAWQAGWNVTNAIQVAPGIKLSNWSDTQ